MRLLLVTILSLFLVAAHAADTDLRAVAPSAAKSLVVTDMGGKKFSRRKAHYSFD